MRIRSGGPRIYIHQSKLEVAKRSCDLGTTIDGDFFAGHRINSNLSAKEKQIVVAADGEVEHSGILQKKLAFFREKELIGSEIEFLRVHVRISKIGIGSEVGYQVGAQAQFYIHTA